MVFWGTAARRSAVDAFGVRCAKRWRRSPLEQGGGRAPGWQACESGGGAPRLFFGGASARPWIREGRRSTWKILRTARPSRPQCGACCADHRDELGLPQAARGAITRKRTWPELFWDSRDQRLESSGAPSCLQFGIVCLGPIIKGAPWAWQNEGRVSHEGALRAVPVGGSCPAQKPIKRYGNVWCWVRRWQARLCRGQY